MQNAKKSFILHILTQKNTHISGCKNVHKCIIATVTMHICTVTVALAFNILVIFLSLYLCCSHSVHICIITVTIMHLCTFLHPMMWVFFWPKCVNLRVFCILQDFAPTNVDALKVFKPYMTSS